MAITIMHRLQSHYNVIRMSLSLLSLGHTNYQTLWIVGMLRKNAGARATHIKADFCVVRLCYTWVFFCFLHVFPRPPAKWHKTYFQHLLTSRMYHPPHLFPFFANHSSTLPMYLTSWLFPLLCFHRNQETIRAQQHSQVVWVPPVECLSLPS